MWRKIIGVIVGLVVAGAAIAVVEGISSLVYRMPAGLDLNDKEAMKAWVSSLPFGAFLFVLAAHVIGAFAGSFVCAAIVRKPWFIGTLIIAGLLLLGGTANLFLVPHPVWFGIADLILYMPSAFAGLAVASHLFPCDCQSCIGNENNDAAL
ncbi:MAG: hypothetical protein AB8B55_00495 [Mariniblastus sp.]